MKPVSDEQWKNIVDRGVLFHQLKNIILQNIFTAQQKVERKTIL